MVGIVAGNLTFGFVARLKGEVFGFGNARLAVVVCCVAVLRMFIVHNIVLFATFHNNTGYPFVMVMRHKGKHQQHQCGQGNE